MGTGSPEGRVVAVRTGRAVTRVWNGRTFVTAAAKDVREGPVHVGRLGLDGDEQGNLAVHGGPDKAVLLCPIVHYPAWRADGVDLPEGGLFENLTIDGLTEADVHLGDTWQVGGFTAQVTQPRRPCRTLGDRWERPTLPREVQATGRTGFYVRVLDEGPVAVGDRIALVDRPARSVSAYEVGQVMNIARDDPARLRRLLDSPELPARWREVVARRLEGVVEDDTERLGG